MTFYNTIRFPTDVSAYGTAGGPTYHTSVVEYRSGREKRNIDWVYPRQKFEASTGVKHIKNLQDVLDIFHIAEGQAHTFRYKDNLDYKSCAATQTVANGDQSLGTGDGSTAVFQLYKYYILGGQSKTRKITKPISGTTIITLNGVSTSLFTTNTSTGEVTFPTSTWSIVDVDDINDVFTIDGDKSGTISDGDSLEVTGSTGNDGVYTISGTSFISGDDDTEITVIESISSSIVDGDITYGQPNYGVTINCGFEFDVPVRFDTDQLSTNLDDYLSGSAVVPLVEDKNA